MRRAPRTHARVVAALLAVVAGPACGSEERAPRPPMPRPDDPDDAIDAGVDAGLDPDFVRGGIDDPEIEEPPPELLPWASLEAPDQLCFGFGHACGLDRDGHALCWGDNGLGQATPPANTAFVQISCGEGFTCGLTVDSAIECWGAGEDPESYGGAHYGQAAPPSGQFKEVAAGGAHACAITSEDDVVCWGAGNPDRPVGIPPSFGQASPPEGKFKSITAHQSQSCAIALADDSVRCWGGGRTNDDCFPPRSWECGQSVPAEGPFVQVRAGFAHGCGLRPGGELACWGRGGGGGDCAPLDTNGAFYECGQGMPSPGIYKRLASGFFHSCAVAEDDVLHCWGWNAFSQAEPPEGYYTQAGLGEQASCAVTQARSVVCFGNAAGGLTTPPEGLP